MSASAVREIRLLLVDDHAMFREGLVRLLEREPDLKVVGKCATAAEALALLAVSQPTIILLDFDLGAASRRRFTLMIQPPGLSWRKFPVVVE